jgi:hypothetical protein
MNPLLVKVHRFLETEEKQTTSEEIMRFFSLIVKTNDKTTVKNAQVEFEDAYSKRDSKPHTQEITLLVRERKQTGNEYTRTKDFLVDFFKLLIGSKKEFNATLEEHTHDQNITGVAFQSTDNVHHLYIYFSIDPEYQLNYWISTIQLKTCTQALNAIRVDKSSPNRVAAQASVKTISAILLWDKDNYTSQMFNFIVISRQYAKMLAKKAIVTPIDPRYSILIKFIVQHMFPLWSEDLEKHGLDKAIRIIENGIFSRHYTVYQISEQIGVDVYLDPIYQRISTQDTFEAFSLPPPEASIPEIKIHYKSQHDLTTHIKTHLQKRPILVDVSLLEEVTTNFRPMTKPTKLFIFLLQTCAQSIQHMFNIPTTPAMLNTFMYLLLYQITGDRTLLNEFNTSETIHNEKAWTNFW